MPRVHAGPDRACRPVIRPETSSPEPAEDRADEVRIEIALVTFDAGPYLQPQLDSIAAQTHRCWRLHVADDGSTDATPLVLRRFADAHPGQVIIHEFDAPVRSPKGNVIRLLTRLPADVRYVALCDQDDVWYEHKLAELLRACREAEVRTGPGVPCLAHSDLAVTDDRLRVVAPSFARQVRVDPARVRFGQLLVENSIPGCSMLFNGALLTVFQARPVDPEDVIMHDWWLALLGWGCGTVRFVPAALMAYRQHGTNAAGSVHRSGPRFVLRKLAELPRAPATLARCRRQAVALRELCWAELTPTSRVILDEFCALPQLGRGRRILVCLRRGIVKQTVPRRLQQLLTIWVSS